jgi:hypothetical protein
MFLIVATVLGLSVAGAGPADTVPHPVWTLSSATAAVEDTISAWLTLTIPAQQRVVSELQSTATMKTWFASDTSSDSCSKGPSTSAHTDSASTALRVCALLLRPGDARLVALVRREPNPKSGAIQAVSSEAITIKPAWSIDLPAWSIALLTSITGFLAGLTLQFAQQRRQRKDKIADEARETLKAREDHRRETEQVLTKALAPEIAVNVQRLRDVIAGKTPQILNADASVWFTEKQRGLFAYLGDEGSKALDDLAYLYTAIGAYNRVRNKLTEERTAGGILQAREQRLLDGMRAQAPQLLAMLEDPHQDAMNRCETIKKIASQTI